jgi:hypothetical protein
VTQLPAVPSGPAQGAILSHSDVPGQPPTCGTCGQYLPWNPPLCTCGHPVSGHHETSGKAVTYCCIADERGPCDCSRYEHAVDGHYGPRAVTS